MNRIAFLAIIFLNTTWCYGQIENRWQPNSVYKNKNVKRIYVYENSPKDLSEIVEFDRIGKVTRIEKYSASYNARTRKLKNAEMLTHHLYNSLGKLSQKIDSIIYPHYNSVSINKTFYNYKDGHLISSRYFKGRFEKPYSETIYTYEPFKSTTTIKEDIQITYIKTKRYPGRGTN